MICNKIPFLQIALNKNFILNICKSYVLNDLAKDLILLKRNLMPRDVLKKEREKKEAHIIVKRSKILNETIDMFLLKLRYYIQLSFLGDKLCSIVYEGTYNWKQSNNYEQIWEEKNFYSIVSSEISSDSTCTWGKYSLIICSHVIVSTDTANIIVFELIEFSIHQEIIISFEVIWHKHNEVGV